MINHRISRLPIPSITCAVLLLTSAFAHAQSGFTVNTLTGAFYPNDQSERLDNDNKAYGNLPRFVLSAYLAGLIVDNQRPGYVQRSAVWPVSTAANVAAANRFSSAAGMSTHAVSDNGVWQGLFDYNSSGPKRANGTTITSAATVSGKGRPLDINNQGYMVGYVYEGGREVGHHWPTAQGVPLDCGGCISNALPVAVNNQGVVLGWGSYRDTPDSAAYNTPVLWRNGAVTWRGNSTQFGINAWGVAINDAGTLVVNSHDRAVIYTVSAAGTVLQLPVQAGRAVARDINAAGVVVGKANDRAALWINGQQLDLAAYLAAKGVSQANTWQWLDIYDINDKGSMLVHYRLPTDTATTIRKARLTAKP
jgi:hypothetical protein